MAFTVSEKVKKEVSKKIDAIYSHRVVNRTTYGSYFDPFPVH